MMLYAILFSLITMSSTNALSSSSKPHILSVGLVAVDFVATIDHFPTPDEKMRSTSLVIEGGGNAANTACAIGRLGYCQSSLATAVANDANGNTILQGLRDMNVNLDHVQRFEGSSPFSYIMSYDEPGGDNTRTIVHQPSTGDLTVDFVKSIDLEPFAAVHFDVRYPQAAVRLAQNCVKQDIPYSVDVERPREGLDELLKDATAVICNSNYCDDVLNADEKTDSDPADKLRKVVQKQAPNAKVAVMTLGSKGCCLISLDDDSNNMDDGVVLDNDNDDNVPVVTSKNGALYCSAFGGCKVVDTTGAGDAFQGGFITALWSASKQQLGNPMALAHALRIASRVAAKKVEQSGARRGLPSSDDAFIKTEMKAMLDESQVVA